ncbi:hypothetical protein [Komagataeibacter melaceti]|uniref:hypothetical protein n=1 Tax=Komagataeibacter melaceti TaxID=2766577 RepID=UPI0013140CF6|nr:hypothetical protein [Komagataeibacter melaceti]
MKRLLQEATRGCKETATVHPRARYMASRLAPGADPYRLRRKSAHVQAARHTGNAQQGDNRGKHLD